ncbi:S8 family peptidase [Stieleria sp. TO1_6]|uniref:S8 family peptidase n=1 Tax=Stieleria tagensis TaxID=2956795 RepID=UPI00209A7DC2|nr:S8 family peptidase [Stieleria tagensis]MCO8123923.1 S8 family peptidase [Stieleria tagensis]
MKFNPIRIAHGKRPEPSKTSAGSAQIGMMQDSHDTESILQSLSQGAFEGTVIYVHGIANKPVASTLKCQWDRALFGTGMGQRSRMVYWVNRDRYPDPLAGTCSDADLSEGTDLTNDTESLRDEDLNQRMILAADQVDHLMQHNSSHLSEHRRQEIAESLRRLAERVDWNTQSELNGPHAEVLPLPSWARDRITRTFTRYLLNDVYDYCFDPSMALEIDNKFRMRVSGGGPFVVIAHSLGSVIAYRNLCRENFLPANSVRLFLTLGSPLGIQEIQDNLKPTLEQDQLGKPNCVKHWLNVADRLDPVAADPRIANDIDRSIVDRLERNLDRPRHPHSATGYLGLTLCKESVRRVVGAAFAQPISSFSIARDLTDRIEDSLVPDDGADDAGAGETQHVLIELHDQGDGGLVVARERLLDEIKLTLGDHSFATIQFCHLNRYVAADLTSMQIERLGPILQRQKVGRIWSDSEKMTLSDSSTISRDDPVQAVAAARVYNAQGEKINWAVLDTGIEPTHPHFLTHGNVRSVWDCTHKAAEIDDPDFSDPIDRHGHGTHVAAILAGQIQPGSGSQHGRNGVAPKAGIHSYKVLDNGGRGRDSYIIRALDHIASVNEAASSIVIHGINLSLGGPFDPETYGCGHSPICRELRRLWRQGVLVVVAAGNAGFAELQSTRGALRANLDLSIGDPANLEEAIAVGSVHLSNPLTFGTSFFSSRGPTADGRQKPDLVAPGERVPSANYAYRSAEAYIELSGTSMAAPHVSGLLAAFLSRRRELIGEPDRVKAILLDNCTTLHRDSYVQGSGLPNLVRMLLAT